MLYLITRLWRRLFGGRPRICGACQIGRHLHDETIDRCINHWCECTGVLAR